jgi:hypothetical protein
MNAHSGPTPQDSEGFVISDKAKLTPYADGVELSWSRTSHQPSCLFPLEAWVQHSNEDLRKVTTIEPGMDSVRIPLGTGDQLKLVRIYPEEGGRRVSLCSYPRDRHLIKQGLVRPPVEIVEQSDLHTVEADSRFLDSPPLSEGKGFARNDNSV